MGLPRPPVSFRQACPGLLGKGGRRTPSSPPAPRTSNWRFQWRREQPQGQLSEPGSQAPPARPPLTRSRSRSRCVRVPAAQAPSGPRDSPKPESQPRAKPSPEPHARLSLELLCPDEGKQSPGEPGEGRQGLPAAPSPGHGGPPVASGRLPPGRVQAEMPPSKAATPGIARPAVSHAGFLNTEWMSHSQRPDRKARWLTRLCSACVSRGSETECRPVGSARCQTHS